MYSRVCHVLFSCSTQKSDCAYNNTYIAHFIAALIMNSRRKVTSTFSLVLQKPTIDFIHLLSTFLSGSISLISCLFIIDNLTPNISTRLIIPLSQLSNNSASFCLRNIVNDDSPTEYWNHHVENKIMSKMMKRCFKIRQLEDYRFTKIMKANQIYINSCGCI